MSTILGYPEHLPAEKLSKADTQMMVDQLMEFDNLLSQPFTRDDLQKLFSKKSCFSFSSEDYSALTGSEKEILAELNIIPEITPEKNSLFSRSLEIAEELSPVDRHRQMKSRCVAVPQFEAYNNAIPNGGRWYTKSYDSGKICVWLDSSSEHKGFYYVRWQKSMLAGFTTAYKHPVLIVQKSKLRPDQIEYMERKCEELKSQNNRKEN